MADLVITASQVLVTSDTVTATGNAGATITAGQAVYFDGTNYQLGDADNTSTTAGAVGLALHASLSGQPIKVATGGSVTLGAGAAQVVGTTYVLSDTAGGICPDADATTGSYKTILGIGGATNTIILRVYASGQQIP